MAQETEKSFPFDAEETETGYDKEYVADDFARYFRAFISSGIFIKDATNLQVIANGDMAVTLKAGKMIIDGYRYENTGDIIITIDPADGVLGRIDRISVTWSKDDRDIHYTLQKGTPSYEPVAPECRRTEEYKDYVVADIYVAAGVIKIQQQNITDQRLNSDVCGLAIPFSELNTDAIFTQYQDAVNEFLKFADTCIDGTVVGQIEEDLENKLDKTGDSGDNVVAFTQTSGRQNIMTGDTHKTIFGKIKKWLADLTATAFAQMITTKEDLLATKVTGYVPDAKAVADGFADVNRNLVKYNEETDSLDVFFNGEIAGSFPCGFQALDLYNYGDECVDVTGGWTIFNSHVNATFTKTANGMYLKTTGDGVYLNIKTANTIDFSKYSKLCIETSDCKLVRSQPWMLYVKCGGSTYDIVKRVSEYRTETIDLPDTMKFAITGNNETNVTITVNNGGAYADSVTEITIHRIYLIK